MIDVTTIILVIIGLIAIYIAFIIGTKTGAAKKHREWEQELPNYRKDAIQRSRAVLGGQFSENLAPYLPDFPYKPNECTFVGKPIDFLVFKGSDEKKIEEVIFVEVKSGDAKLSTQERNLKKTIEEGRVKYEQYRIPKELTAKDNMKFDENGEIQ